MKKEKPPRIEQKIEAGPGATIRNVQQIVSLRATPDIPFQAPPLPRYFVPRPEVSRALIDGLMTQAPPDALVVSAVHGLGGVGKTTLVAALAHDPAVQACFPDGVLWVTLGQQPDVLSLLSGWIQALGDRDFYSPLTGSASNHLRTLLREKACLLVVDDAWQADHVRPFLMGKGRCHVLVTTRDATLARKVGAHLYDLDVMTEAEALSLLEARLGPLDGDREPAAALARELGYLPLALELAAAQVEAGVSWTELLDAFRQELADLSALDLDEPTYRNESLRLSFGLSLDGLPDGGGGLSPDDRQAFGWLGVLPEDARLNPAMAATLWDGTGTNARKRLRRLREKALLKPVGDDRYTLHDLLHDQARLRLAEQMPLPEAHAGLLDRYRRKVIYGQWHRLPDDGYIHKHLTWHMEQAGQPEAIHALLQLETPEGCNAWYTACEALGQIAGYLDDVRRAWRLTDSEALPEEKGRGVGKAVRYALITSSINSLAGEIPPALLVARLEKGMWTPAEALACARRVPGLAQRARVLARLSHHLPEPQKGEAVREAYAAAHKILYKDDRRPVLIALDSYLEQAPSQPDETDHSAEALAEAYKIGDAHRQARALMSLSPNLPGQLEGQVLQDASAAVREIEDQIRRSILLKELVPRLAGLGLFKEALAAAQEMPSEGDRIRALNEMSPCLSEPLQREVWAIVREIQDENVRAEALTKLAPHLPKQLRARALKEALAAALEIEEPRQKEMALAGLAPHLPKLLRAQALGEALAAAHKIEEPWQKEMALAELAVRLAELGYPKRALAVAQEITSRAWWVLTLARLALWLPDRSGDNVLEKVLPAVQEVKTNYQRRMLAELLPRLAESGHPERALALARQMQGWSEQALALAGLAHRLAESGDPQEALAVARLVEEFQRAPVLIELIPRLAELGYLKEGLAGVEEIPDARCRAEAWIELLPFLPESSKTEILEKALMAGEVEDANERTRVLVGLAARLPEPLRTRALERTLAAAQEIEKENLRASALVDLISGSPVPLGIDLLARTLVAAQKIEQECWRARVLAALVSKPPAPLVLEILAAVRELSDVNGRAPMLAKLVSHLSGPLQGEVIREALVAAREIEYSDIGVRTLVDLAPHLSEALLKEALAIAMEISYADVFSEPLAGLAPYLSEPLLEEVLAIAQKIEFAGDRGAALVGLAPYLPEPQREQILEEGLRTALPEVWDPERAFVAEYEEGIPSEAMKSHELASFLTLKLTGSGRFDLSLAWISRIKDAEIRAEELARLADQMAGLPPDSLYAVWHESLPVLAARNRADLLSDLCPLTPALVALGEEAVVETCLAIRDAGRWWL